MVKNSAAMRETWVQSPGWEDPLEKGKATIPVSWPGKFHGLWGRKESDTTERLSFSLSVTVENEQAYKNYSNCYQSSCPN